MKGEKHFQKKYIYIYILSFDQNINNAKLTKKNIII